jgi:hypothetical protein
VNTDNGKVEEKVTSQNSEIMKTSMQCLMASRAIASAESYSFDCSDLVVGNFITPVLLISRANKAIMINYLTFFRD